MDTVLNWLWQGGVVTLALVAMLRMLERSPAQARYIVCWAALVTVFVLPLIPLAGRLALPVQAGPLTAAAGPIVLVPQGWWTSSTVVVAAWALWAGTFGIRLAAAMLALRRVKTCSHPFPAAVEPLLRHWVRVSESGRRAALMVSDRVTAAAVLGGGVPVIAVAPALVRHLDADELDRIIIHEWAHVRRRDDVANVVQLMARAIAGWHPAVWWIDRRLRIEREVACDEITVAVTGSAKSYAACLVKLASLHQVRLDTLPAPGALSSTGLRERITRIVSRRELEPTMWSRGSAAVAVALLCALSLTIGGFRLIETAVLTLHDAPQPIAQATSVQGPGFELAPAIAEAQPPIAGTEARMFERHPAPLAAGGESDTAVPADSPLELPGDVSVASLFSAPAPAPEPEDAPAPPGSSMAVDPSPPAQPPAADAQARSPWDTAAEAGVAIGRRSRNAGVATAGFFNQFARRIAGSF